MTQEQILKIEHLKVAEVRPGMFVHIHAEDDYVITAWKEGDDIKNYTGSVCIYMPIRDIYDAEYRTISITEHNAHIEEQRALFEADMNEKMNRE